LWIPVVGSAGIGLALYVDDFLGRWVRKRLDSGIYLLGCFGFDILFVWMLLDIVTVFVGGPEMMEKYVVLD
jgi:hypothetical protein